MRYRLLLIGILAILFNCGKEETEGNTLFQLVSSEASGVDFKNDIPSDDTINILTYEYLYNGGGVGIADFNNDGLQDIFFTGNLVPCRLYINQGNFQFKDITTSSGIDTRGVWAYGVSIVDINLDGFSDIYISAGGIGNKDIFPNKLYINQGDLTFKEAALEYGLDDHGESIQAAFFDYDLDGDLDMYLLTGGGFERSAIVPRPMMNDGSNRNTDRLYRNDFNDSLGHAFFTDVSAEANILHEGFGLGVSILDINEDGWPDVYVTNDYLSPDHLYINGQDGTFHEALDQYFKHTSHFAMGNDVGDINNDGLMDIIAVDMLPENHYRRSLMFGPNQHDRFYLAVQQGYGFQYMRNTLQLNNGNGSFSEIGQLSGIYKTDWSWAPLLADFDNDGFLDLFVTNGFGKDVTDLDFVKFRRSVSNIPEEERRRMLADSLSVRPGIKVSNYVYKNNGDYTFTKKNNAWGFDLPSYSNGAAYADLDNDGDLDLVVNNINEKAFLYRNTLTEKTDSSTHYLRIKLLGSRGNPSAIGSTISLVRNGDKQVRYKTLARGFQSTVEDCLHFGLGNNNQIDSISVRWPDGKVSTLSNTPVDQQITIDYANSQSPEEGDARDNFLLTSLPSSTIPFRHEENDFNDFNVQSLLLHKLSQEGPGVAVGDVNGDGLDDLFIGGAYRKPGSFFIQQKDGTFAGRVFSTEDDAAEDMGCLLFDADQDGDLDLYVVSGGNEYYKDHQRYADRLYYNDGKGNFNNAVNALPTIKASGSCVVAGDYDQDGDLDLFVGGRVIHGSYPEPPTSYLLRNANGKFEDVTAELIPDAQRVGMVTSALWTDYNNDTHLDLIVVGEAMPVTVFVNRNGKFVNITTEAGLKDSDGFWNSITGCDFDNDGDIDYIAGNQGLNIPYQVSSKEPMTICYADYDNNGSVEPFIGCYEEGVNYPVAALDVVTQQVPSLKKHILFYRNYARTSMDQLISMTGKNDVKTLYCKTTQTSLFRNNGDGTFEIKPLPTAAQFAPVYGVVTTDINADGNVDIMAIGNSYATEVVTGRYDAMTGVVLLGDGRGNFNPMPSLMSGFSVTDDAKAFARCDTKSGSLFVVTQNNDSLRVFTNKHSASIGISAKENDASVIITYADRRKRKEELYRGNGYLSQSSRTIPTTPHIRAVEFFNNKGELTRTINLKKSP